MHHGREPASFYMNLYILLYLLKGYSSNDPAVKELLSNLNIYFVPIINADGYVKNNLLYETHGSFEMAMVRKNQRRTTEHKNCEDINMGIDLNRNYAFQFGSDNTGSSVDPCMEDYRGTAPFTESEVVGIKNFVERHVNIKVAFNYHAWGNLFIMPFNYLTEDTPVLAKNYTAQFKIYDEFIREAGLPKGNRAGNGKSTIGYTANGECSDWMLGEKGIIAFSPELGTHDKGSDEFYPNLYLLVDIILKSNLNAALYGIQRAGYFLKIETLKKTFSDCKLIKELSGTLWAKDDESTQEEQLCLPTYKQYISNMVLTNSGFGVHRNNITLELNINKHVVDVAILGIKRHNDNIYNSTLYFNKDVLKSKLTLPTFDNVNDDIIITLKLYVDSAKAKTNLKDTVVHSLRTLNASSSDGNGLVFNKPKHELKLMDFEEFKMTDRGILSGDHHVLYRLLIGVFVIIVAVILAVIIILCRKARRNKEQTNEEDFYKTHVRLKNMTHANINN
jgi:hypothetical protein